MDNLYGKDSKWIGLKDSDHNISTIFYFRRKFQVNAGKVNLHVRVSADSRYKLYINEKLVLTGPCKGNVHTWHYETADLTEYLADGSNTIAAEVLHIADKTAGIGKREGFISVERTSRAAFLLDGVLADEDGNVVEDLSTDEKWKVRQEEGITFTTPLYAFWAGGFEHVNCKKIITDWKSSALDDTCWMPAEAITSSSISKKSSGPWGELTPWMLKESPIPQLTRIEKSFKGVTKVNFDKKIVTDLLTSRKAMRFSPGACCSFELDAGELTTGYLSLHIEGGKGSTVKIIYSECYEAYGDGKFSKQMRDNSAGVLRGDHDFLEPDGRSISYETFWFRTFRYIRIEICTGAEELIIKNLNYLETGYPLQAAGTFESSDETHLKLWDISVRTLKRCMHETYEDCPYYEQLQYTMDSRLEMLFTYQLSEDDRLARKCIDDFHSSLLPEGLIQSRYPSTFRQIIPGFCLHWIFMLEDHLMYFGDMDFIKYYRPTVDAILGWFDRNIMESGLVGRTGYWSFVDWVEGWDMSSVPKANRVGPITVYSLMYAKALQSAAKINESTGRAGVSEEYLVRAGAVMEAVRSCCYDEDKQLFMDGPGVPEFSQHTQLWAVCCGAVQGKEAKELMLRALSTNISKASYAMSFYLFRALEKTGLYHKVDYLLNPWRELANRNLTTWVEDPVTQRSECHGWGAVPLYEFPAMILGVKPAEPGYGKIEIKPHTGSMKHAKGSVSTKKGVVSVEWKVQGDEFRIDIVSPEGVEKVIILPDESVHSTDAGRVSLKCDVSSGAV